MPKWGKWPVLLLGVVALTMLASSSYAQQSRGNASLIASQSFWPAANKKARRTPIGKCHHRENCQYCCFFPFTGNSSCVFDLQFCGQ
jgi:hypothetical protein